eukprot:8286968-Alexandrium_andersonii.AAC.1
MSRDIPNASNFAISANDTINETPGPRADDRVGSAVALLTAPKQQVTDFLPNLECTDQALKWAAMVV